MTDVTRDEAAAPLDATKPLSGFFADPDLHVFDGRYWLYATTDGHEGWAATAFHAFSSLDLTTWRDHGEVLDVRSGGWASGHGWAPAVAERGGRYFLYFTADRGRIGVAVADGPAGPFVDIGRPLIEAGDFTGVMIDPSVFMDGDTAYLYWGNTVAHGVPLNDDMVSFDPALVQSWMPPEFREAAWVHRREDLYYLSWSVNDTRSPDYCVHYATGATPFGPWVHRGVLLAKDEAAGIVATGHHSIVKLPDVDEWVIAYHRFAIPDGDGYRRQIRFDRLVHGQSGSIERVIPSALAVAVPLSTTRQSL